MTLPQHRSVLLRPSNGGLIQHLAEIAAEFAAAGNMQAAKECVELAYLVADSHETGSEAYSLRMAA